MNKQDFLNRVPQLSGSFIEDALGFVWLVLDPDDYEGVVYPGTGELVDYEAITFPVKVKTDVQW